MYKMPPKATAKDKKDPKKAPKLKMAKGGMTFKACKECKNPMCKKMGKCLAKGKK